MKLKYGLFFFALALLGSRAIAQTAGPQGTTDSSPAIATARCQYTPAEAACGSDSLQTRSGDDSTIAQAPRGLPRRFPPRRGPMTFPGRGYPAMWMEPSGRHALIGAMIGFGLGAVAGARGNTDQHPGVGLKAAILVGGIGAMVGAVVGASIPSFHARHPYRRTWPDADELDSYSGQEPGVSHQGSVISGPRPAATGPADENETDPESPTH